MGPSVQSNEAPVVAGLVTTISPGKNRMELTKDGRRMLLTVDADTEVEMKTWSNVPPHEYDFRNPGTIRVGFETVIPANRASQLKVRLIPLK